MLKFVSQLGFFSKFSLFPPSATKPTLSCCCYRRANLDAWCCTEQRGGRGAAFKGFTTLKRGLLYINSPFQVQKSSFPSQHTIIPIGFIRLQLVPSRQTQNAALWATAALSSWHELVTTIISDQRRRHANGHSSVPAQTAAHGGGKVACADANGVIPAATFVSRTQSWLLCYGHEKLKLDS